jgi:hypothetical protein
MVFSTTLLAVAISTLLYKEDSVKFHLRKEDYMEKFHLRKEGYTAKFHLRKEDYIFVLIDKHS